MSELASAIYVGEVRHRRFRPVEHSFRYRMFMMYVDLDELPQLFDRRWLWSVRRPALARFRREDHLGNPDLELAGCVRELVGRKTGSVPEGPIRLLTHFRYFGCGFNPVSFYYVFDRLGDSVECVVAEVSNTPWDERHLYVVPIQAAQGEIGRARFDKDFHVSPFMPMDVEYGWQLSAPGQRLFVHMESRSRAERMFDATLHLRRRSLSGRNLSVVLLRYPFMTARVIAAIHLQGVKLWRKRVPIHPHPHRALGQGGAKSR